MKNLSEYVTESFREPLIEAAELDDLETIEEAEVTSDKDFTEYATKVLKDAHGDDFDEEIAKDTIDGILDSSDGDYGEAVGKLKSGLGS